MEGGNRHPHPLISRRAEGLETESAASDQGLNQWCLWHGPPHRNPKGGGLETLRVGEPEYFHCYPVRPQAPRGQKLLCLGASP